MANGTTMNDVETWFRENLTQLTVAGSTAIATAVVALWVRRKALVSLVHLDQDARWREVGRLLRAALWPSLVWIALLSGYVGVRFAPLSERPAWLLGAALLTVLALSIGATVIRLTRRVVAYAGDHLDAPAAVRRGFSVGLDLLLGLATALTLLHVWGVATGPFLLVFGVLTVLAVVALRDVLPSLIAAFQLTTLEHLAVGDYIDADGVAGTVTRIGWRDVEVRTLDGGSARVSPARLVATGVRRQGAPERRAERPLRFFQRSHLRELTGLKAASLQDLASCLEKVPASSVYYHTHQFLGEHQYLVPTPTNELAEWVGRVLGLAPTAEALGAVDVLEATSLEEVRARLLAVLKDAIAAEVDRTAAPGQELYFLKSVTVVTPCPYTASSRAELAGVVRRLSHGSLFFHLFEARLLGGPDAELDIVSWLRRQLGEPALAADIATLNPYDYSMEGLRTEVLRRLERT